MRKINYAQLPTEKLNRSTRFIDRLSIQKAFFLINKEDQSVAMSVKRAQKNIVRAVKVITDSLKNGGRMFFIGAGTSGRLGILEAAECPPTFGISPSMIQAFMAGGRSSVFRSKEGAEDKGSQATRSIRSKVRKGDVVVGIAASGVTAFVQAGLKAAKKKGAKTILVTCHPGVSIRLAQVVIAIKTGPEVIAGSTRLKAGTATKMVLNSLTILTMIQLGKVFGNRMVDLQPRSRKLVARATRLISLLGRVSPKKAALLLKKSNGKPKTAIVMARLNLNRVQAHRRLTKSNGHLHAALK